MANLLIENLTIFQENLFFSVKAKAVLTKQCIVLITNDKNEFGFTKKCFKRNFRSCFLKPAFD